MNPDFFVGYNWPQPQGLLRAVKRAAIGLGVGVVGLSGGLALGHLRLEGGSFEFGQVRKFEGTIVAAPQPMLRPEDGRTPWPLLVAAGKHGADDDVRQVAGQRVELDATRIARGDYTMLEIAGIRRLPTASRTTEISSSPDNSADVKTVTLRGEIVDTKCFLGVMVPGSGHTHRDCASLCLRGGIPPALLVREADGSSALLLLVGPAPLVRERAGQSAGMLVEVTGTIGQQGGWQTLSSNPAEWRQVGR